MTIQFSYTAIEFYPSLIFIHGLCMECSLECRPCTQYWEERDEEDCFQAAQNLLKEDVEVYLK